MAEAEKNMEEKSRGTPQPNPSERGAPEYYSKDRKPDVPKPDAIDRADVDDSDDSDKSGEPDDAA